jgi:hypothetical protein
LKSRRVQQVSYILFEEVHDKDSTHHASIPKGGAPIETGQRGLGPYFSRRLGKTAINVSLNVALHTGFDGIGRMRQIAGKEAAEERRRHTGGIVVRELFGIGFHERAAHDRGNGKITAGPERLANHGAGEAARKGQGRQLSDILNGGKGGAALALLLNHNEFQGTSNERRDGAGANSADHFFGQREMAVFSSQDHVFEGAADDKLNHGAGTHIEGIRADATVHDSGVEYYGLLLLYHVLGVIEGLQNQHLTIPFQCVETTE